MQKYFIVVLVAVVTAMPAIGATPAAPHSEAAHAAVPLKPGIHGLTASQRRARLAHERVVKRIAEEHLLQEHRLQEQRLQAQRLRRRHAVTRARLAQRRVTHGTVRRSTVAHPTVAQTAYARRVAAHRAYERRLAHERWLRAHRAYEARLAHERWLRAHHGYAARLAVGHRTAERGTEQARIKVAGSDRTEIAKAEIPQAVTGAMHPASLDYVSHAHIHLYWSSPLRGTHASLVRQDERDRAEGLTRIENEAQLLGLVRDHSLIPLPLNEDIQTDPRLAYDRRYTRPWTAEFLRELGVAYRHQFGEPLVITSAVRPATYQRKLTWRNGNAAPANGVIASPHEFGATIDIGKKGMTSREMAWMRGYLLPLQQAGQIDVEEEFYQACFHVTVYKNYVSAPVAQPQPEVADAQGEVGAR
jgi:hypothetical protein